MMNKRPIMLIVIIFCLSLVGCSTDGTRAIKARKDEVPSPKMTVFGNYGGRFSYAVDENTGVVYLIMTSGEGDHASAGITVAYDVDGTVMTKWRLDNMEEFLDELSQSR